MPTISSARYVIFRSGYLRRTIGGLLAVAGACYLVNSFAHFLDPALGAKLFNAGILVPCLIAELSLAVRLIAKGVDAAKWDERTGALAS